MKRAFDFTVAAIGLLVAAPILAALLLLIRLDTPGSPIFAQTRIGRYGHHFTCFKLRTMNVGTGDLPTHMASASAITRLGGLLRKWKFDELPQLYNVLLGQMSLVGPRPCLPSQSALIEARQKRGVLTARPGVTGLAQVRGVDMSDPELLAEIDAEYVQQQNFVTDIQLIMATLLGGGVGVDRVAEHPSAKQNADGNNA